MESIKTAGLVLLSDVSGTSFDTDDPLGPSFQGLPKEIDGTLRSNGILRFMDSVDMN
jgi:CDK inhibitor PHO81